MGTKEHSMSTHGRIVPHLSVLFALLASVLGAAAFPRSALAATILVNDTGDDAVNDGTCTLREAIAAANNNFASGAAVGECAAGSAIGTDQIDFNVGGGGAQTILVGSPLPDISSRMLINGPSQPSYAGVPLIRVDGNHLITTGFNLTAGSSFSTIKGLMIVRFNYGIYAVTDNLTFQGNYIGTDGANALGGNYGIVLEGENNQIGGTGTNEGNVLTGTNQANLFLSLSDGNTVQGNIIGTDSAGSTSLSTGVGIRIVASNNVIGGTAAGAGNLISGNVTGISQFNGSGTTIQGNKIGTNLAGTAAVSGSQYGVAITSADNITIGGSAAGAGNLISGNTVAGIYVLNNDSNGSVVKGNLIGTNAAGTSAIANAIGIRLEFADTTTIGGSALGEGNVVAGNTSQGLYLNGATGSIIQGNYVGTDGSAARPNGGAGIDINAGGTNTVGGGATGEGNLISGNTGNGITVHGGAFGSVIRGNYIGTDAAGKSPMANANGILVDNGPNTTVGGSAAGQGNLISGNISLGVVLGGSTGHVVTGNTIGADKTGMAALQNGTAGLYLTLNASAQVNRNLIAYHSGTGVYLDSGASFAASSTDNCILDNSAGVNNTTGISTTFTNNWWGDASGPSGAGGGTGDSVSADVVFNPWLTGVPAACAPAVVSIVRANADPTSAASVDFDVVFSRPVTGVDASDFDITITGLSNALVSGVSGANADYVVTVNLGSGTGTARLDVSDDDSIVDASSAALGGAGAGNGDFTTGEVYTVDRPRVLSDFDGDQISDPVKFDSTNSAWWQRSSDAAWAGTYLGPGTYVRRSDFDADLKADPAKFDASNSLWYVESSSSTLKSLYVGPGTYTFVGGSDFEGDGRTDPAQFNSTINALWYFASSDAAWHGVYLGPGTYGYVSASDFDADGRTDPGHFDSASNVLWYQQSSDMTWYGEYLGPGTYDYVEGSDFDGDGMTDPAQFTPSSNTLWYVPSGGGGVVGVWMGGTPLSYVAAADFDGDGMTDPAGFDSVSHLLWYLPSGGGGWTTFDMGAGTYAIVN